MWTKSTNPKISDKGLPQKTAKLFSNGGSQAVRLPKEFAFAGSEVLISREGDRVVLEAVTPQPPVKTIGDLMQHLADLDTQPSKLRRPPQPAMPPVLRLDD